ncbi:hypothetical protein CVT24_007281 [Panaeolus cyanescens]|uniref:Helicase ATP-binding domain-containing protein n=1 Tax=Panaeolus cyanescens TaxID=181874 RepID=A0A409VJ49_9AGAR|nr:hypothetical protein CVT24_007281 [Panaeolus cyanescens]
MTSQSNLVRGLLDNLYRNPEGNTVKEETLGAIFTHLYDVKPNSAGEYHWFCSQASTLTIDAATFSIRLFAYSSEAVTLWKARLRKCISCCASCVRGMELAKELSRKVYMSTYEVHRLDGFFNTFEAWELQSFLDENPFITQPSTEPTPPLSEAALHQMLWNWTILSDPRVARYLQNNPPPQHITITGTLPPGLFVLLFVDSAPVRQWASNVCSAFSQQDLGEMDSRSTYSRVLTAVIPTSLNSLTHAQGTILSHYSLTSSQHIWSSFYLAIRLLPSSIINPQHQFGLPQLVINHLRDVVDEFSAILRCFVYLLKRLQDEIWKHPLVPSPVDVVSSLQQNPNFLPVTNGFSDSKSQVTSLRELLLTIRGDARFPDTFSCVLRLLLDRARYASQDAIREQFVTTLNQLLSTSWRQSPSDQEAVTQGLKQNANAFIPFVYANSVQTEVLARLLSETRKLTEEVLLKDCQDMEKTAAALTDALILKAKLEKEAKEKGKATQKSQPRIPVFSYSSELWDQIYLGDDSRSPQLFSMAIRLAGKVYHLFSLRPNIFKPLETVASNVTSVVDQFNASLKSLHGGLGQLIMNFTNYSVSNDAISLLQQDEVLQSVVLMMLSHSNQLESAAKAVVGLAYDVDGRTECFRALLERYPKETMKAMMDYLSHFYQSAIKAPEACDSSAALVRCFADILDVLCAQSDGLLRQTTFLLTSDADGPAARLPKFWRLLAKALSAIYDRTPMWSSYVSTPEMVSWMRDALILARDVLTQWRVIENAVNSYKSQDPGPLRVGKDMIGDLQDFLPAVVKWLRLTDEELLHQSFSLLQNVLDVMKETDVQPWEKSLTKLRNFVTSAQESDSKKRELRTRLDTGRLILLVKSLSQFDEEDDEVEIVEPPPSHLPSKSSKPPKSVQPAAGRPGVKQPVVSDKEHRTMKAPTVATRQASGSKKMTSDYFSEKDQERLDSISSMPAFRRSSASGQPSASTSKPVPQGSRSEIKDEAQAAQGQSDDNSSDDEGSESDGNTKQALRTLGLLSKKSPVKVQPKPPPTAPRRVIMQDDFKGPVRTVKQQESHNRALCMRPDITDLHRAILSWDYNHSGPSPPGPPLRLCRVPQRFQNYLHYLNTFRPLLLMECWHSLLQSKDETQDKYNCVIDDRQVVSSDGIAVFISIPDSVKRDWYLAETDVVLLSHPQDSKKCILGKVKTYQASHNTIKATILCFPKLGLGDPGLTHKSNWQVSKVFSLSTINREYGALVALQYNKMCASIMNPSLEKPPTQPPSAIQEVMGRYNVNEPQATAILNAISVSSFSLIQGPPGTGKTSTICGLISRFMADRIRPPVPIVIGKAAQHPLPKQKKILLCAPSNAAIDELVQRLKDGYAGSKKSDVTFSVVRIGAESAISSSVRDVSLDYLVDQKIQSTAKPLNELGEGIKKIQAELDKAKEARNAISRQLASLNDTGDAARYEAMKMSVSTLNQKVNALSREKDAKKDQQKSDFRVLDALRRNTRREILLAADVICSTLSGAGHESLEGLEFDMVIIDEAAQSIELSSLIPLRFEPQRCVMVGDPQQLPPTVLSNEAKELNYGQSLFARLHESRREAVQLLSIQYRMHPNISHLPSSLFYNKRLLDGPDMEQKTAQPWHSVEQFSPYRFYNVSKGLEVSQGNSMTNETEAQIAAALYGRLTEQFSQIDFSFRVGVVTMYRAQLTTIRRCFERRFGRDILSKVDFNTVDGFQGQEKDIIILSCVRAGPGITSIGFLSDVRRMNVALTRARSSLFILGHAATLERSESAWRQIVQDARSRSSLIEISDPSYFAKSKLQAAVRSEAPPPKKRIKTNNIPPSIPASLATPSNFKNSKTDINVPKPKPGEDGSKSTPNASPLEKITTIGGQSSLNPQPTRPTAVSTTSSTISAGTKRPAPDDRDQSTTASGSGQPSARPKPPVAQKKAKTNSMFIPKKIQKR